MHKDSEKRHLKGVEIRSAEGKPTSIAGYAAVWDAPSQVLSECGIEFVEIIRRGAFSASLAGNDEILGICYHDFDNPLARRSRGTLVLMEDDHGLRFEMTLANTTRARDLIEDIKAGNVEGVSFSFRCRKDKWTMGRDGSPATRELIDVELIEVSPTAIPAYTDTTIAARSLDKVKAEQAPKNDPAVMQRLNAAYVKLLSLTP